MLGPRDRNAIPRIISVLKSPLGALVGDGENRVPAVVVEELVAAIAKAATTDAPIGGAYNISGREELTQRQMMSL